MFDGNQLNSIGFRFVMDNIELLTPYGEELARHPHFYGQDEKNALKDEQRNIAELMDEVGKNPDGINELMRLLMPIKDIRRSVESLNLRTLTEVELFEIKRFLLQLELIAPKMRGIGEKLNGIDIKAMPKALDLTDPDGTRSPSFYVSDRLSEKLGRIRRERREVDDRMKKDGATDELMARRTQLAAQEEEENARVRADMCDSLKAYRDDMMSNIRSIGRLDFALGKARLALKYNAVIPNVGGERFIIEDMTNPRFSSMLREKGCSFVPVSLELSRGSVVVTGANMGGKSIAIKTLALNTMLAMCGFAVFAGNAEIPMLDDVFILSEDREDAMSGLSSFGGEMKAFGDVLRGTEGKRNVLVLLDEFARGTNPHEGAAIVRAAATLFNNRGSYAVIATHFDGVAKLAIRHYQVAGLRNADVGVLRSKIGSGGADMLAEFMDYGLYEVDPSEEPPRDAVTIIHALGVCDEFTELIDIET